MVEIQAVARVIRLGQKRNVRVVRYIMKRTMEEVKHLHSYEDSLSGLIIEKLELSTQQIRKLEYAKIGWKDNDCE
jgi:SNF2 family DNA or RNA helicase